MSVSISKQLKKESIKIDRAGNVISHSKSENANEEFQRKRDERAKKLGFK